MEFGLNFDDDDGRDYVAIVAATVEREWTEVDFLSVRAADGQELGSSSLSRLITASLTESARLAAEKRHADERMDDAADRYIECTSRW